MKTGSTKKQFIINFLTGFFSQFLILVLGLIVPRIILDNYGSDTNGLINTITQIFAYMALLEAGISQAATNKLYKPIKHNEIDQTSSIVATAKNQFRKISYIYGAAVLVLSAVLPFCLKSSVDYWTIFFIILFEGLTNVFSFYFINTWTCVLNASGRNYAVSGFNLISRILCYAVKIVLSLFKINIAVIQVGYFIVSLIKLLIFYLYYRKHYKWIKNCPIDKNLKLDGRNSYLITELCTVIFLSTDMIVLSLCVSTSLSSVYSIYNLVFSSLSTLLNAVFVSVTYVLNQTYIEDVEKYKKLHDMFNSFFIGCMAVLMCVSYFMITPFVKLYTDGITDIEYINQWYPLLFSFIPLLSWCRYVPNNLAGISGNFKKNAIYSIIEAVLNLSLSFILVFFLDIIGVLIATVVALPIRVFLVNYLSEKHILKRNGIKTIIIIGVNLLAFGLAILGNYLINGLIITSWLQFIGYGVLLVAIFVPIVFGLNLLANKDIIGIFKLIKQTKKKTKEEEEI